jgi:cytochrome P450
VFTPKFVESFRPGITQLIETLLDRIPPGPFDFGASMAKPLSIRVVACLLIGLAESDLPTFMSYLPEVSQIFNPSFPKERALAAREKLKDLWRAIVDSRRKAPREDFASILVKAMEAGELPEGALLETLTVTFVAGNMSTAEMMKNTLLQLLRHPLELEKIERDPSLLKNAIEEALRLDGPIASINRVAPEDMEVRGCPVRRGQVVSVLVGPAARGPEVNDDPQTFDITRQKIKHLAFGAGQHFCIGAPLARLETELVLDALFRRFPNLRLDPDRPPAPQNSPMVNGVDAIWVIP